MTISAELRKLSVTLKRAIKEPQQLYWRCKGCLQFKKWPEHRLRSFCGLKCRKKYLKRLIEQRKENA